MIKIIYHNFKIKKMKKRIIKILWWIKYAQNPYNDKLVEFEIGGIFFSFITIIPSILTFVAWAKNEPTVTTEQKSGAWILLSISLFYWGSMLVIFLSTKLLSKMTKRDREDIEKFLETKIYI